MFEWNKVVQEMIDWIEDNLSDEPTLLKMSKEIGYSPFYCSSQFHHFTKMTLRSYIAGRRLCKATLELRDTNQRIIDIAVKYGYSSQEAFTRAFVNAFGITPMIYRKNPKPIRLAIKQYTFFPEHYIKGENEVSNLKEANVRFEFIPKHKFIGVWDSRVTSYHEFWQYHDCDEICGVIDSLSHIAHPMLMPHTAGWYFENGKKGYFYGFGVESEYNGEVPEGFEIKEIPASYYLVFFHPQFDFLSECGEVMERVEHLASSFDPKTKGYQYNNEVNHIYQIHYPEVIGYEIYRAVKKI